MKTFQPLFASGIFEFYRGLPLGGFSGCNESCKEFPRGLSLWLKSAGTPILFKGCTISSDLLLYLYKLPNQNLSSCLQLFASKNSLKDLLESIPVSLLKISVTKFTFEVMCTPTCRNYMNQPGVLHLIFEDTFWGEITK